MKNILITGYYGFANTGDELVLGEVLSQLRRAMPGLGLTVLSHNPEETAAAYQVEAVNRWDMRAVWAALRKCDLFVLGGGSLLQDITGRKSLFYYLGQILLARLAGRRVFLYAQGIGPLKSRFSRRLTALILKGCACITLRDEESRSLLAGLGLPEEKLFLTIDPVLAMENPPAPPPMPEGKRLGLALRPWPGLNIQALAEGADALAAQGWQIVFLPFHEPQDRALAQAVAEGMKEPAALTDPLSPPQMYGAVAGLDGLIGMRLHALILAAAAGIPFAALSYDPKIDAFCCRLGLEAFCHCQHIMPDSLPEAGAWLDENGAALALDLKEQKQEWAKLARANGLMAAEYALGAADFTLAEALKKLTAGSRA